jgi:hypothetical protein
MLSQAKKLVVLLVASVVAVGLVDLVWAVTTTSSEAQQGAMFNCPQPDKWAIAVWDGDDGTDAEQALATCGEGTVAVAYGIDPNTQDWLRYFAGRPDISNLITLDEMQGVMALGSASAAPTPTASATSTPTSSPTPTPTGDGGPPTAFLETFHAALDMSMEVEGLEMDLATEGDFEAPASCSCDISASMAGIPLLEERVIVIGNNAWVDTGDGWRETTTSDLEVAEALSMCPAYPSFWEEWALEPPPVPGEHETKNNVPAIHYTEAESCETFLGLVWIPEELAIETCDLWLAEDGYWPVCLEMELSQTPGEVYEWSSVPISIDITRVNDPSIQVNAP